MTSKSDTTTDLHAGLKNKSPKAPDEKPKGASVNSETTRGGTAKSPKTLGPREA